MKKNITFLTLFLSFFAFSQKAVFPFNKDGKWGVINSNKKILLKPEFEYPISFFIAYDEYFPLARFKKDDLCGLINKKGKVVLPAAYNAIISHNNSVLLTLRKDSLESIFNRVTKKIIVNNIVNGKTTYEINFKNEVMLYEKDSIKKYDQYGDVIFVRKRKYYKNSPKSNSFNSGIKLLAGNPGTYDKAINNYEFKNKDSSLELIQIIKNHDEDFASYAVVKKNNKLGITNKNFKIILDIEYDDIKYLYNPECAIIKKGDKYGYFNLKKEKFILPLKFDEIIPSPIYLGPYDSYQKKKNQYSTVKQGNYFGYANENTGEVYLPK